MKMRHFDQTPRPALWPSLEAANLPQMLSYLGTSSLAQSHRGEDITWIITGVRDNTFNGVASTRLSPAQADSVIRDVLQRLRSCQVPFLWFVDADSQPSDLARRLVANGCKRMKGGVGMAADLHSIQEEQWPVPGLVVERVTEESSLNRWFAVQQGNLEEDMEPRKRLYLSLGLAGDQPLRHYLAHIEGEPIAACSLFLAEETAGLYNVITIPSARRRGIGTAITLTALREARRSGYRLGVLAPDAEVHHFYERLGFVLHPSVQIVYY